MFQQQNTQPSYSYRNHTLSSVMVRNLDGRIRYWNRACERKYGWPRRDAVGSVSHNLLNTVFPEPLEDINHELISKGYWQGYLIHTLSNGSRVKVWSRWDLVGNRSTKQCVVEINERFARITPNSAHLLSLDSVLRRFGRLLMRERRWWVVSAALTLCLVELLFELTTAVDPIAPLPF